MKFNPTWSDLHSFGQNRLLQTTYFWIVAVPIVAKVFNAVEKTATVTIFGHHFQLTLALPFPWVMFFYGSVFAAIAGAIYLLYCPKFLQTYPTFAQFSDASGTSRQLTSSFAVAIQNYESSLKPDHLAKEVDSFFTSHCEIPSNLGTRLEDIRRDIWKAKLLVAEGRIKDGEIAGAFWQVRSFLETQCPQARRVCGGLFCVSLGFFLVVIILNIWFVISWQLGR